jgi:acyl-coenzyme A thioesterase PaaI-like protein
VRRVGLTGRGGWSHTRGAMKLSLDPTSLLSTWNKFTQRPLGKRIVSRMIGMMAPYTGTIGAQVVDLAEGYARAQIRDRWGLRNHLKSLHAVALMNLGELTTGMAMMSAVPKGGRGIVRELQMQYVKKARGTITAEARAAVPSTPGTHDVWVEGELKNAAGETVAVARALWRLDIPAS